MTDKHMLHEVQHRSPKAPKLVPDEIEQKITDIIADMTLEEKIGQMVQLKIRFPEEIEPMCELISQGQIGSMIMKMREPEVMNQVQKAAVESRTGIPLLFCSDVLHGFKTSFPVCIAEASCWDLEAIRKNWSIASAETSANGFHVAFGPMIAVARDSRWGRQVEGAGVDVLLSTLVAEARTKGYLEDHFPDSSRLAPCPKHFAAYGGAEAGIDYNTVEISEATFREIYLPPFAAAVEAGAPVLMSAFNEINGMPATGWSRLLNGILREEWGFDGFVISDYNSIEELVPFGLAKDRRDAAVQCLKAGVDMDMGSSTYLEELPGAVRDGDVEEALVDQAVRRILRVKFWTRAFENPYVDVERRAKTMMHKDHIAAARKSAAQSAVVLENKDRLLPLSDDIGKLAVVGPFADEKEEYLGRWHCAAEPEDVVTILAALRERLGEERVLYAKGCEITDEKPLDIDDEWFAAMGDGPRHFASDEEYSVDDTIANAVEAAREADVAVCVLGQIMRASGEGSYCHSFDLPAHQQRLLEEVFATGTPTVLILMGGRVMTVRWAKENVPAIIEAWELGHEAGHGVADLLFGDEVPCGRLPVTVTPHICKEPVYYNHKRTGRPRSRYFDYIWPFGYGLSYTNLEYKNLEISAPSIGRDDILTITAEIENNGGRATEECVQLYLRDEVASLTRPVKTLVGFQRLRVDAGQSATVTFELKREQLGFFNNDGRYIIEPGDFTLWVGPHSQDGLEANFKLTE
ncbi:MAG: glycoside hydrolase family 3 N-terminal domain-containing protein [Candidatus Sumerlaeota bacterium]